MDFIGKLLMMKQLVLVDVNHRSLLLNYVQHILESLLKHRMECIYKLNKMEVSKQYVNIVIEQHNGNFNYKKKKPTKRRFMSFFFFVKIINCLL